MWRRHDPFLGEIIRFSLFCRGATLTIQVLLNLLIPDHAADAFSPPKAPPSSLADWLVEFLLSGLGRWDAEHFLFIAEHGYLYEHNMAFFPLLPMLVAGLARGPLLPLAGLLSLRSRLLLSAAALNCVCSTLAAALLYLLGCVTLQSRRTSFLAGLLFCMSPISVFLTVSYSESLFAATTFSGLWLLQKGGVLAGSAALSLATAARSNGLVNVGFLLYSGLKVLLHRRDNFGPLMRRLCGILLLILPFALFQSYCYFRFCTAPEEGDLVPQDLAHLAEDRGYRLRGPPFPAWCSYRLPLAYSHIQSEYWGVGLFRYFQLQQLPNFLLAAPVVTLGACAVLQYVSCNLETCLTLGLVERQKKPRSGFYGPRVFVHVAHLAFLMGFGVLCMHVQVVTRLLFSSCPVLFWFCALMLEEEEPWVWGLQRNEAACNPAMRLLRSWTSLQRRSRVLLGYFLGYWVIGTALHVNFLPWT
ncbi:GPI mannosyltransferase 2 [Hyperolius riggenbachi]|uniref:GPI mannosyltransferase 2 n=1 Tax=Hyperolius riggenbachi TaxID=752182 RepID=UPI0035A2D86B